MVLPELGADIKGGNKTFSETMIGPYNRVKELADAGAYPQNCSAMTYAQALAMFTEGRIAYYYNWLLGSA